MNAITFITVAVAVLSSVGLIAGRLIGRFAAPNRVWLTCLLSASLLPWFQHHLEYIRQANYWLEKYGSVNELQLSTMSLGPAIVLMLVFFAVANQKKIPFITVAVPGLVFCITYFFTFPLVIETVGFFNFDNVPTIWLFIWCAGATIFFCSYMWQGSVVKKTMAKL